ncbi:phosphoribosyltransferase-like protein [Nocardia amamiensis]|uniref:phosphoribosyltransferase-like protein n=1 Tax=Nocardia amamiensis TaxID=404578 RepID=UPI0033FD49A6
MKDDRDMWRSLYSRAVAEEDLIAGLHRIELIEEFSPYRQHQVPYFTRVERSLNQLPPRFRDAALAVFANVVYLPSQLLDATFGYLWHAVIESARHAGRDVPNSFDDIHVFEVDPSGLAPRFAQLNALSGRLNADRNSRISDVQSALTALTNVLDLPDSDPGKEARHDLRLIASKKHWIVLTDKALSGQSLVGDIERFVQLRRLLNAWTPQCDPHIYVCAQVMTADAQYYLGKDTSLLPEWHEISLLHALLFDERAKVNSAECEIFATPRMHDEVRELCEWFATNLLIADRSLHTIIARSKDGMAYGYRGCGLLLADAFNTPTNSLPILWYSTVDSEADIVDLPDECAEYHGPFFRTHSRRGLETPRWASARWSDLHEQNEIARIVRALGPWEGELK